jgi:ribonuclease P protein component
MRRSPTDPAPQSRGFIIPDQGFKKADRVRKRVEIENIFARGRRFSCKGMRVHILTNAIGNNRVVFVPVRSYPNSVTRNRARRLGRECWRDGKSHLSPGHDVAVVLYPGFDFFGERKAQLEHLLRQAGLYT